MCKGSCRRRRLRDCLSVCVQFGHSGFFVLLRLGVNGSLHILERNLLCGKPRPVFAEPEPDALLLLPFEHAQPVGHALVELSRFPQLNPRAVGEIVPDRLQPRELARAHLHLLGDKIADPARQLRAALAHGDERLLEPPRLLGLLPVGEDAPRAVRVDEHHRLAVRVVWVGVDDARHLRPLRKAALLVEQPQRLKSPVPGEDDIRARALPTAENAQRLKQPVELNAVGEVFKIGGVVKVAAVRPQLCDGQHRNARRVRIGHRLHLRHERGKVKFLSHGTPPNRRAARSRGCRSPARRRRAARTDVAAAGRTSPPAPCRSVG